MKQKWMLEVMFKRFFENKFELRARSKIGKVKDTIYRAAYDSTLKKEFTDEEIKAGLKHKILQKDQIRVNGAVRNIYMFVLEECKYQPVWHKRVFKKITDKVKEWKDALL